jgi:hypothetical protein
LSRSGRVRVGWRARVEALCGEVVMTDGIGRVHGPVVELRDGEVARLVVHVLGPIAAAVSPPLLIDGVALPCTGRDRPLPGRPPAHALARYREAQHILDAPAATG